MHEHVFMYFVVCSYIYETSPIVINVINFLEDQRSSLLEIQEKHGVKVRLLKRIYLSMSLCYAFDFGNSESKLVMLMSYRYLAVWIASFLVWSKPGLLVLLGEKL